MKKIMVIALILVASFAGADSWLSVEYGFQFGWVPKGYVEFYETHQYELTTPFDVVFKIDTKIFNFIKIGGNMTVNFSNQEKVASPVNFYPSGITFLFNAGFYLFPGISLMYEHSCSHPIIPYLPWNSGISILDGGFDRVYLEIKGKINY